MGGAQHVPRRRGDPALPGPSPRTRPRVQACPSHAEPVPRPRASHRAGRAPPRGHSQRARSQRARWPRGGRPMRTAHSPLAFSQREPAPRPRASHRAGCVPPRGHSQRARSQRARWPRGGRPMRTAHSPRARSQRVCACGRPRPTRVPSQRAHSPLCARGLAKPGTRRTCSQRVRRQSPPNRCCPACPDAISQGARGHARGPRRHAHSQCARSLARHLHRHGGGPSQGATCRCAATTTHGWYGSRRRGTQLGCLSEVRQGRRRTRRRPGPSPLRASQAARQAWVVSLPAAALSSSRATPAPRAGPPHAPTCQPDHIHTHAHRGALRRRLPSGDSCAQPTTTPSPPWSARPIPSSPALH